MAFESTRNLLSSLIQQQRETELMQQTPQFQAAVDQLFANRVQFAQNQVVMDKLGRAQSNDEVWEALKTVKPEDYVKRKREQLVGGQIFDLLKKSPEQERDYGLINYLASSIGYGDVGPIERRPMPEEAFDQQLKLYRSKKGIDKYYGDREVPPYLRMQREREFMDYLDRGILYKGQPVTEEQKDQLQRTYLKDGFIPKEFDIEAKPLKPQTVQRPTKDQMSKAYEQAIELVDIERSKLGKAREGHTLLNIGLDKEDTFKNMLAMTDDELDKLKVNKRLKDFVKLFRTYGLPESYIQEGAIEPSDYTMPPAQVNPNDPLGIL